MSKTQVNSREKLKQSHLTLNSYLASLDIKTLYRSNPNAKDINALKKSLKNYPKRTVATNIITTLLALILALNSFILNATNYLQNAVL